jgi:5-methylcytosine-specific restriction protein B
VLEKANLPIDPLLSTRFVASACAKRFVILTGLSGSGKTKLAHAFAEWISDNPGQLLVIPVGADWTNRENLLGYPDALTPGEYRLPTSGILQLILAAAQDQAHPYFLILDEMNLSHVERYFADILSVIESEKAILLHEQREYGGKDWSHVPYQLDRLPENLFVIGTVNIDETTYMFSPKVLDRANVIEFRMEKKGMLDFIEHPVAVNISLIAGKGKIYARTLLAESQRQDATLTVLADSQGTSAKMAAKNAFGSLFSALEPVGAEFGYRPVYEMSRFLYFYASGIGATWKVDDALDAAIMQKLLPKLHGSKMKLGPVLTEIKAIITKERFPISFAKIERMELRLKQNGFTSYAEA